MDFSGRAVVVRLTAHNFLSIVEVKDAGTAQASFLFNDTEILVRSAMLAGSEVAFSEICTTKPL